MPPLWPLDLDAWLLAVVVTLATEGLLSSLKYATSGESLPGGFWVGPGRSALSDAARKPGDICEPDERLSLESFRKVVSTWLPLSEALLGEAG